MIIFARYPQLYPRQDTISCQRLICTRGSLIGLFRLSIVLQTCEEKCSARSQDSYICLHVCLVSIYDLVQPSFAYHIALNRLWIHRRSWMYLPSIPRYDKTRVLSLLCVQYCPFGPTQNKVITVIYTIHIIRFI